MNDAERAILAAQDWLLHSDEAKAAIPSTKARLELLHPLRLGVEGDFRFRNRLSTSPIAEPSEGDVNAIASCRGPVPATAGAVKECSRRSTPDELPDREEIARLLADWQAFKRRFNPLNWFRCKAGAASQGAKS